MAEIPLDSSNLKSMEYDPDTKQLKITFRNDRAHTYYGVPQHEADNLQHASSAGRYFNENIKDTYDQHRHA